MKSTKNKVSMKVGYETADHALILRAAKRLGKKRVPFIREASLKEARQVLKGSAA